MRLNHAANWSGVMKNQDQITVMCDAAQMAERREQRRYEISMRVLAGLTASESEADGYYPPATAAIRAVELADALLAELERTK